MTEKILQMLLVKSRLDCSSLLKLIRFKKDLQELEHAEYKIQLLQNRNARSLENMDKIVAYCDALIVVEILVELPHMKCH
jgi:hypothetical protein